MPQRNSRTFRAMPDQFTRPLTGPRTPYPAAEADRNSPVDAVTHVGLPDQRSAEMAPTWRKVLEAGAVVRAIPVADLEALLAEYEREGTLGPIADPAAYERHAQHIPQWRDITRALLELRRTIARVEELEAQRR